MVTLIIIVCAVTAAAQIPTITITTSGGKQPPGMDAIGRPCGQHPSPILDYIELTGFSITNAGLNDVKVNVTKSDFIRRRGNSTATGGAGTGNMTKIPYRVKFDKRINLLDMGPSKNWALLANYYDPSFMLNTIAFELGNRLGLDYSRPNKFVNVTFNGVNQGIYMLTPQLEANEYAGVNVELDNGGWLVEFDYHGGSDAQDCLRFFTASSGGYNMNTKIIGPSLSNLPLVNGWPDISKYSYVKNDINGLMSKMREKGFPNNGYRDLIDVLDWAKYVLIQLFMDNFDFNNKAMAYGGGFGGWMGGGSGAAEPGSNYAYKINASGKIKAGPLWDFDLAAGVSANSMDFQHFTSHTDMTAPEHPFYKRLWQDKEVGGFLMQYRCVWDQFKSVFQSMSQPGGFIDTQMELLASSAAGNIHHGAGGQTGMSYQSYGAVRYANEKEYRTYVGKLKTWWNKRYAYFDKKVPSFKNLSCNGVPSAN